MVKMRFIIEWDDETDRVIEAKQQEKKHGIYRDVSFFDSDVRQLREYVGIIINKLKNRKV